MKLSNPSSSLENCFISFEMLEIFKPDPNPVIHNSFMQPQIGLGPCDAHIPTCNGSYQRPSWRRIWDSWDYKLVCLCIFLWVN